MLVGEEGCGVAFECFGGGAGTVFEGVRRRAVTFDSALRSGVLLNE